MSAISILQNAATRPRDAATALRDRLTPEVLNAHPAEHPNSIAWLLWHTGREIDIQTAMLAGTDQVWDQGGYATRTGLGPDGAAVGLGQSADEARAVRVDDADVLLDYVTVATQSLLDYLGTLSDADLDDVIDEEWDPPVTRGVRLVSIIDDAAQHVGQAAYALGALTTS